ncbi:Na+/H+ antiporter subunit E [Thiocapsa marina]|uniref:Cation antiporter n=1 Tax=Thiocapsa marina 5811 TaxID=768671 RepID=F9U9Y8_9GAMM|nr:Na+/H+ antiporter subunit E [Thiocapsa marina]EGV18936.1 cation antiporter [Thiocapsa marina 5811]
MDDISADPRPSIGHYLFSVLVLALLWLLLAGSLATAELIAALAVGILVTAIAGPRLAVLSGVRLSPLAPWHLLRYLLTFFTALVAANLDMARRVLSPSLPLRPALVEVRTRLRSSLGRMLLANSITLTPGTLAVDIRGDRILVHWVDCPPGTDLDRATAAISDAFERHIRGFLE